MQDEVSKAREKTAGQPQNGEWDKGFEESVVAGTEGCWGLANLAIRVGEPEWGAKFYHRRAELLGKGTHGEDKWLADFCLDQAHKECHPFAFWQEERLPRFEVIERFLKVALSADFDLHEKREMLLVLSILVRTACEAGQFSWGEQYVEHTLSAMPDLKDTVVADCYFYLLKCAVHQKISELQSIRYAVQAKDIIVTGGVMDEFAKLAKDAAEIGQIRLAWVCLRRMVEVSTAKDAAETLASTTAREIGIAF